MQDRESMDAGPGRMTPGRIEVEERRRSPEWHLDPSQIKKVTYTVIGTLLMHAAVTVGGGLWAFFTVNGRFEEFQKQLAEQAAVIKLLVAGTERVVRLEVVTDRLEKAVDKIDNKIDGRRSQK